jgi:hypothetical protein
MSKPTHRQECEGSTSHLLLCSLPFSPVLLFTFLLSCYYYPLPSLLFLFSFSLSSVLVFPSLLFCFYFAFPSPRRLFYCLLFFSLPFSFFHCFVVFSIPFSSVPLPCLLFPSLVLFSLPFSSVLLSTVPRVPSGDKVETAAADLLTALNECAKLVVPEWHIVDSLLPRNFGLYGLNRGAARRQVGFLVPFPLLHSPSLAQPSPYCS